MVNKWYPELQHYSPHTPTVLVGLKSDLRDNKRILERLSARGEKPLSVEEGKALAQQVNATSYHDVSALMQTNLHDLFKNVAQLGLYPPSKAKPNSKARCAIL